MKLAYTLAMPEPATHLYHVTLDVELDERPAPEAQAPGARGVPGRSARGPQALEPLRVAMPAWAPGSYLVRDFARHMQDFEALDARGRPVPWRRVDKQTWEVGAAGGGRGAVGRRLRIRYRVYANELSVRTSHLDATHGYANGTSVFVYVEGHKHEPCTLRVRPPRGWRVDVALPKRGDSFLAADYDELADSPLEIGTHRTLEFRVRGKRHRVALYGHGNEDAEAFVADLKRIVEEEAATWGVLPYGEYLFIVHLADKPGGGLEHRASNTSIVERWSFQPRKKYEDVLALEAHELFHAWNVKRLRPSILGPFDYTKEQHTTLLWAMEGLTSYYDHLVLARAGLISEERYRDFLAETITKLRATPGRFVVSLADASFLAWVKHYKPDANTVNTYVSYYLKGELLGLALDLAIRDRTRGRKTLDDVLRALFRRYPASGPGIPEAIREGADGWREALEEETGLSWRAFWATYVEGTDELDLERFVKLVGWELRPVLRSDDAERKREKGEYDGPGAWLGVEPKEADRRLLVASVLAGSPALAAGVSPDDELVALDGYQLKDKDALERRLRERMPGDRATLHVFRRGELVALDVALGENPPEKWELRDAPRVTPRMRATKRAWLAPHAGRRHAQPVAGGRGAGHKLARRE
jgi:predicted metalloprotease with PDZ domain